MVVPETKGRTIADILEAFHGRSPLSLSVSSAYQPKLLDDPTNMEEDGSKRRLPQGYGTMEE